MREPMITADNRNGREPMIAQNAIDFAEVAIGGEFRTLYNDVVYVKVDTDRYHVRGQEWRGVYQWSPSTEKVVRV